VDIEGFTPEGVRENFYVTASRMVPYKRIDLIVEAFAAMPERELVVIGAGPEDKRIRAKSGPNVRFLGPQAFTGLRDHLRRARAFVFAAEEDFGIAPLEAQACGTPVIAFGKGGVRETVIDLDDPHPTGVFFEEHTVESLVAAVASFEREQHRISPVACRANAARFRAERFRTEFRAYVDGAVARWRAGTT
jgi:glycosyltransferase involved in cell wall biosynthesis